MDAMHRHYEQERAQLRDRVESLISDFHTLQAQNMTLLQERDRYRAALEQIIDLNSGRFPLPWNTQRVAREALNPK